MLNTIRNFMLMGLAGLALVGCKTESDFYGEGPLNLSSNTQSYFDKYKSSGGPGYFAINQENGRVGWSYCRGGPDNCSSNQTAHMIAINACQRGGGTCKIYARGNKVVWRGPVTVGGSPVSRGATNAKSDEVVCAFAVDYAVEPFTWSTHSEVIKYVAEAKRRGLSLEDCDKLN